MRTSIRFVSGAAALLFVAASNSFGLGFRNPDQDARATGQGEAFVAQADDASAIYYNPGGLTQIKGTEITGGGYISFPSSRFKPVGGGSFEPKDSIFVVPHFYAATDFGLEKWRFGLGCNVPFGNSVDWGKTFQYLMTKSDLAVYNIQPTVAYKFNEHFSLGAGLNVYHGNTTLERNLVPMVGGGHFKFDGDGEAFGATAGLLWRINDQNSVGLVYRSPFAINFGGTASLHGNVVPGLDSSSDANASIEFPQSVAIGYALRPVRKLKLEVDVEWTNWDTLNNVLLHSKNPLFDAKTNPAQATVPFNWMDSFYYELGAQYDLAKHWVVRGGYLYSENSVPQQSFSPMLPDSNRHVFSAGLGYNNARLTVDAVYQYSLSEDRTINTAGSPLQGKWSSSAHTIMLTTTFKF